MTNEELINYFKFAYEVSSPPCNDYEQGLQYGFLLAKMMEN